MARPQRAGSRRAVRLLVLLLAIPAIGWRTVPPTRAETTPLPASAYPPHTQLTYFPRWANQQFDCNFGWFCDGDVNTPYLHVSTEYALHRLDGWAIWGEWQNDRMGFELYSSVYSKQAAPNGVGWNRIAAADEEIALLELRQARMAPPVPSVLPDGVKGGVFEAALDKPGWHILFLTAWWCDTHEVEGAVLYPVKKRAEARRYLTEQVRMVVQLPG